ncbi:Nitrogen fixation protein FixH [Thalassovita litoralis]|jgi:nitrogen fixation protein FixH|uniref:Nitrogen fixation protein FixH n=1 Tax=Thalassovita litoralis TaxID=1010611 RepID=A0A521EVQ2_9RHOB|nr:FixH family protein [Thalassovita litoralis]SMO87997.1 Nitrogen fixation protein FixH [Thalassovita litoralis]
MTERQITGRQVFMGFAAAFGLIIAVNVFMAVKAVKTFPGLEVANSYVASQEFNKRKAAQEALGWSVRAEHRDGMLRLAITGADGAPVRPKSVDAIVGRTTENSDDMAPALAFEGGEFIAPVELSGGKWIIRLTALAEDGTEFTQRLNLHVVK